VSTRVIHLRLPEEHLAELETLAEKHDRSLPDEMRRALRLYVKTELEKAENGRVDACVSL
jgi:predicted transcriptional regulator